MAGRLIVEQLDGETLVYDTERNEAHALSGAGAAAFLAVEDEVSRREILRKLALAGAAVAGTGALVKTIVAPTAAQAQSICGSPNQPCCAGNTCPATPPPNTQVGCVNGTCLITCGGSNQTCCQPGDLCNGGQICQNGTCMVPTGNPCNVSSSCADGCCCGTSGNVGVCGTPAACAQTCLT
jgi:hypothetical protein